MTTPPAQAIAVETANGCGNAANVGTALGCYQPSGFSSDPTNVGAIHESPVTAPSMVDRDPTQKEIGVPGGYQSLCTFLYLENTPTVGVVVNVAIGANFLTEGTGE